MDLNERAEAAGRVDKLTEGVPWSHVRACHLLFDLALAFDQPDILEVSCCYGKATAYLATAARLRAGFLRAVDNLRPVWEGRDAADLVTELNVTRWCDLTFEVDARWWLLELFTAHPGEWIDLAFVDASHAVEVDSFIALAAWTHLKPGAVLVFDDLNWTAANFGVDPWPYSRPDASHVRTMYDYIRGLPDVDQAAEWGAEEIEWPLGLVRKRGPGSDHGTGVADLLDMLPSVGGRADR